MELIVDFRAGVTEERARAVITAVGGSIRRRMRTDDAARVRLLARLSSEDDARRVAQASEVERTEVNQGGFRPL